MKYIEWNVEKLDYYIKWYEYVIGKVYNQPISQVIKRNVIYLLHFEK
jgi:hypothetical protein